MRVLIRTEGGVCNNSTYEHTSGMGSWPCQLKRIWRTLAEKTFERECSFTARTRVSLQRIEKFDVFLQNLPVLFAEPIFDNIPCISPPIPALFSSASLSIK